MEAEELEEAIILLKPIIILVDLVEMEEPIM
jgi:hypothetical protein